MTSNLVFPTMGTVASLAVNGVLDEATSDALRAEFERLEERFSVFRPGSEASAVAAGRLAPTRASAEFRSVWAEALHWQERTDGAFTPVRPDGAVDLTGIVKAVAIRAGGRLLREAHLHDWCLNVGGDVLCSGTRADGAAWSIGIVDPADRQKLCSQFQTSAERPAVATSGLSERGEHIWGAHPAFAQVTVAAADIVTADVLATAVLAGGPLHFLKAQRRHAVDILAIGRDGRPWASRAFRAA